MKLYKLFSVLSVLTMLVSLTGVLPVAAQSGTATQVSLSGTGSPSLGESDTSGGSGTQLEFPAQEDEQGMDAYNGIIDRSLSDGPGNGVSVNSGKKAKSNPIFNTGFEGLNHYQQRYTNHGNQFSIEPPDQALCVGNGYVVEAVNDVLNIFNASGQSVLPDNTAANVINLFPRDVNHAVDLNSFYSYPAAINRTTGAYGPELTDPTCIYDAATQRFFLVVLTLDRVGTTSALNHVNHLDLAVSQSSDPTGAWNIYKIDVTNDGTNSGGENPGPYLGDYPHIGADANGIYLTTNAYAWCCNGFAGAQVYALSKAQHLGWSMRRAMLARHNPALRCGPPNLRARALLISTTAAPNTSSARTLLMKLRILSVAQRAPEPPINSLSGR
jgi:hypothetical protein